MKERTRMKKRILAIIVCLLIIIPISYVQGVGNEWEMKAKIDDKKTYEYSKCLKNGKKEIEELFYKEDNTVIGITVEKGTQLTVKITNINNTDLNASKAFNTRTYGTITIGNHTSEEVIIIWYAQPVMDNLTFWEEIAASDPIVHEKYWWKITVDDDLFISEEEFIYPDNSTKYNKWVRNWKTGWLISHHSKTTTSNGTVIHEVAYAELEMKAISRDNNLITGFQIWSGVLLTIVFILKQLNKSPSDSN